MSYKKIYLIFLLVFILLAGIYYFIERRYALKETPPPILDKDYAVLNIEESKRAIENFKNSIVNVDTTTKKVYDNKGAIKIVKIKDFGGVSPKPVDPVSELMELAKSKKKVYVNLSEKDLDKKIDLYSSIKKRDSEKINTIKIAEPGKEVSSITPIYAPCDYKVFKSSMEWNSFLSHHRVRENPVIDFNKESILTIVSKSELDPGIFKIDSLEIKGKTITVLYKVDVLELSDENPQAKRGWYSVIKIPRGFEKIELKQI